MRPSLLSGAQGRDGTDRFLLTATDTAGEEVSGTLVAPEVAHDMDDDEYRFEATLSTGSGKEADAFLLIAKRALANKLRSKFQQFPKDMVAHHGKDLLADQAAAESAAASGASTPSAPSASAASSSAPAAAVSSSKPAKPPSVNTAIVRATGEFQCDAATLFEFLTSPEKVPVWSRNPAQIAPSVGTEVVMFGGNIKGKVQKVEAPKLFMMSWRAPTWAEEHYGTLEMELNQGSNSTTLNLKLAGVPVGKEDETESNVRFSSPLLPLSISTPMLSRSLGRCSCFLVRSSTLSTSEDSKQSG